MRVLCTIRKRAAYYSLITLAGSESPLVAFVLTAAAQKGRESRLGASFQRRSIRNRATMGSKKITEEFLRAIPKTDLHLHLDGSVRLSTLIELAKVSEGCLRGPFPVVGS